VIARMMIMIIIIITVIIIIIIMVTHVQYISNLICTYNILTLTCGVETHWIQRIGDPVPVQLIPFSARVRGISLFKASRAAMGPTKRHQRLPA
jgi:hypothetical protein